MRKINNLCYETQSLLRRFHKFSKKHEVRQRTKCILLSHKGYSINQLVDIFEVHLNTIYNWLDNWNEDGILSLYNLKGRGRKPKINSDNALFINDLIETNPKQIKKVVSAIKEQKGIVVSERTVKRFIKKNSNLNGKAFVKH